MSRYDALKEVTTPPAGMVKGRWGRLAMVVALILSGCTPTPAMTAARHPGKSLRAFSADSYWNTPVGSRAPVHPRSDEIISFLKADNAAEGCPLLSGIGDNEWGMPIYWAKRGDPVYEVESTGYDIPDEFRGIRIPRAARPMDNSDSELIIYDEEQGFVVHLSKAAYDATEDRWTVTGGSVAYLDSNGLDGLLPQSDDPRNDGTFRGYNGAVAAIRFAEVAEGRIDHVVKVGVNTAAEGYEFPMTGSDGESSLTGAPEQGIRLRIKPNVDLSSYDLHPQAVPIARALKRYGMMVGDSTGGGVELKLEDIDVHGPSPSWTLPEDALCAIPLDAYEVIDPDFFR